MSTAQEFQARCKTIKSPGNKSKSGYKGGGYSFDQYGFARQDKDYVRGGKVTACFSAEFQSARTGKVQRIKKVV